MTPLPLPGSATEFICAHQKFQNLIRAVRLIHTERGRDVTGKGYGYRRGRGALVPSRE